MLSNIRQYTRQQTIIECTIKTNTNLEVKIVLMNNPVESVLGTS